MNPFTKIADFIRGGVIRLLSYKSIEQVEHIATPLSTEMTEALDLWYGLYLNKAPWLEEGKVKSFNLPASISSEIARQMILELKWNITGTKKDGEDVMNPRAAFLKKEFEKVFDGLWQKLEPGCAAGGLALRPYHKDGHIHFGWTYAWEMYPLAFDDDGNLMDVVFPDTYTEGKTVYTRLERHRVKGKNVVITQRVFKSQMKGFLGIEISLSEVPQWSALKPEITVTNTEGPLFGWFKVAEANNIDVSSPMGASAYAKAVEVIREVDEQYSRLLWEYEGSELAIDVDPSVLRPKKTEGGGVEMPKLNERLFREVDADKGDRDLYEVFSPTIRDASLLNGLNTLLIRVEDLCGLSRGTFSDPNVDTRTATELKIARQRTYDTISNNQRALEKCFRDAIRAMDKFATLYGLAPEGEYEASFEWDDSIVTDRDQQTNERLALLSADIISKAEFREWYFGETKAQAQAAIEAIQEEQLNSMQAMLPVVSPITGEE